MQKCVKLWKGLNLRGSKVSCEPSETADGVRDLCLANTHYSGLDLLDPATWEAATTAWPLATDSATCS